MPDGTSLRPIRPRDARLALLAGLPNGDGIAQDRGKARSELAADPLAADRFHWADGYVWAYDPTSSVYVADGAFSFNRTGGTIDITKPAGTTGRYLVRFERLSSFLGNKSSVKGDRLLLAQHVLQAAHA